MEREILRKPDDALRAPSRKTLKPLTIFLTFVQEKVIRPFTEGTVPIQHETKLDIRDKSHLGVVTAPLTEIYYSVVIRI